VFGDHAHFCNGKTVTSAGTRGATYFEPYKFYVLAQMWLEINAAGGDFENLTSAVFRNCVEPLRSAQATLNVGLAHVGTNVGSLRKAQRHQQGRYNHQQEYSFHGILLRFSPCGGLRFHLGFDFAVGPYAEHSRVYAPVEFRPENLEHPEWNSTNPIWYQFDCLFTNAHM
jgi:hypothetical protein